MDIFAQRSSATQWLLCNTEMLQNRHLDTSGLGFIALRWELAGHWQLLPVLLSNAQRLSRVSATEVEGIVCLERAGTICSSGGVVGNTGWLVLRVSVARLSSGRGWKDALPGDGTRAPAPSLEWALSLARGVHSPAA